MHRLILICIAFVLGGCAAAGPLGAAGGPDSTTLLVPVEFVSVEPRSSVWFDTETSGGLKKIYWAEIKNEEANKYLPVERSYASVARVEGDSTIGFLSARATAGAGKYKIVLDYAKYRDELVGADNVPCRIGVGVRIIANVTTSKANIDLGSLFAIAVAAQAKQVSGQIEVLKIGIDSPGLNLVLPPPSEINETSLQTAMQAVAAIRSKIYDRDTVLAPHILAVKAVPSKLAVNP